MLSRKHTQVIIGVVNDDFHLGSKYNISTLVDLSGKKTCSHVNQNYSRVPQTVLIYKLSNNRLISIMAEGVYQGKVSEQADLLRIRTL